MANEMTPDEVRMALGQLSTWLATNIELLDIQLTELADKAKLTEGMLLELRETRQHFKYVHDAILELAKQIPGDGIVEII